MANLDDVSLVDDNVFGDDGAASQLGTVTGDVTSGYTVSLAVGVDTTTAPTGGQPVGDGAPSGVPGLVPAARRRTGRARAARLPVEPPRADRSRHFGAITL